ncbi:MAG: RelA/SpoT family protein [Patescibacteria group bacterium]
MKQNTTDELKKNLLEKITYFPQDQQNQINSAIDFAAIAHQGQARFSGEAYLNHCLSTAIILAEMKMDYQSIVAGLLHDTLEDTTIKKDEVMEKFGPEVADLIDGVTKVSHIRLKNITLSAKNEEQYKQIESLRKLFLAMAKDIRVVIIKLADRLHNISTLQYVPKDKQTKIAQETMEIYVPLANRLGLWHIKSNLEDICFKYLYPKEYLELYDSVKKITKQGKKYLTEIIKVIKKKLSLAGITDFQISGRTKNLYSIYLKTVFKQKNLDDIYDIYAVRIVAPNIKECYTILGVIHNLWRPIPGRFKDYIAAPKSNGYQSLHTSVFAKDGQKMEIQIRTTKMHEQSEYGVAAHWLYKEKRLSKQQPDWVKELTHIKDLDLNQLSQELKIDVFQDRIFIYTPKGDVKDLPSGSTPIDFAYSIHSDIGDRLIGAKVNQKIVNLDYELQNGDIVEILTSKTSSSPKRQWLEIVKTNFARNKIRSFLKKANYQENVKEGEKILQENLKNLNLPSLKNIPEAKIRHMLDILNYHKLEEVYLAIFQGDLSFQKIIKILFPESEIFSSKKTPKKNLSTIKHGVTFGQNQLLGYKLATNCCQPKYPEPILGYITRGQGITVHRLNCKNITHKDPQRLIIANWDQTKYYLYDTSIIIKCEDRVGMLHDITEIIMQEKLNLAGIDVMQKGKNCVKLKIAIQINNWEELTKLMNRVKRLPGVLDLQKGK